MNDYVLLWSQSQNAFHIERVEDMLNANHRAFSQDRRMDYVPVHFGTWEECCDKADEKRPALIEREADREMVRQTIDRARGVAL